MFIKWTHRKDNPILGIIFSSFGKNISSYRDRTVCGEIYPSPYNATQIHHKSIQRQLRQIEFAEDSPQCADNGELWVSIVSIFVKWPFKSSLPCSWCHHQFTMRYLWKTDSITCDAIHSWQSLRRCEDSHQDGKSSSPAARNFSQIISALEITHTIWAYLLCSIDR